MTFQSLSRLSVSNKLASVLTPYTEGDGPYFHLATLVKVFPRRRWDLYALGSCTHLDREMPEAPLQARRVGHRTLVLRDSAVRYLTQLYERRSSCFTITPEVAVRMLEAEENAYRTELYERTAQQYSRRKVGTVERQRASPKKKKKYDTATLANVWGAQ